MITFVITYEMYGSGFGLNAEEYGIKTPKPLRIGKGTKVQAKNGFEAQRLLEKDLKSRFGQDKQVHITSCVSEQAELIYERAIKTLQK